MAEFREVMKQWRRFCKSHSNCGECEFDGTGICGEAHLSEVPYADIEFRIMTWAAEHPAPVYPTWEQVIAEMYLQNGRNKYHNIAEWERNEPIPADIAEKLGIEPKEPTT